MNAVKHISLRSFIPAAILLLGMSLRPAAAQVSAGPATASNPPAAVKSAAMPAAESEAIPATVTVFDSGTGRRLPGEFAGLSYELSSLLPGTNGVRYFRPDNKPLLDIFRTMGIGSLRVGGNMGDRDFKSAPSEADIDSLFAFAKEAGVKVVYCLRLHHGDPAEQARVAKYIWDRYEPLLDCFTIGQEPSAYPVESVDTRRADQRMGDAHEHYRYEDFATNWLRFDDEIRRSVPKARIAGPSVYKKTDWPLRFLSDFAKDGRLSLVTAHLYPGGPGNAMVTTPGIGRDRMLSGEFEAGYRNIADNIMLAAASNNLGLRIEEANNYFNGGCMGVSDTFAASLWGLDFLWWWASRGAVGVNFHTGDMVAAGSTLATCAYSSFYTEHGGVRAQPLAYGITAFGLGARGCLAPVSVSPAAPSLRLSAYAAVDSGMLTVTLINRHETRPADVTLAVGNAAGPAESMALTAPAGDVAAKHGITLGGSEITPDGLWKGGWSPVGPAEGGLLRIRVPAAGAMLVRLPVSGAGWTAPGVLKPSPRSAVDAVTPVANARHEQFLREIGASGGKIGLVLVGDSITDGWPSVGTDSYLGLMSWRPLDLGVSGERTEQVLWRLLHGELEGYEAGAFMVMIGTNNLRYADEKPEWVAEGVGKIIGAIRSKQPRAKILLLGVFPRGASPEDPYRARIAEINLLIAPLADGKQVVYMDIGKNFLDAKGNLSPRIMPDYLHPSAEGYRIWLSAVKPVLEGWLK